MKKKLISMLLAVLMIASLFSGMSISAYADDDNVISYTMKQGDTVLKVCTVHGVNYYTCKNAIMVLNGFSSDADFRFIPVGKVIKIPKSNAAAVQIANAGSTGTSTGTTTNTGTTTVSGDTVAYYLVPHTMQRGETIYTVCSALGISYNTYAKQIQSLNNLSSLSSVKAGQTILFPQTKAPAVGTTCYKVMNHKVSQGETAYTICNTSGVSYNGNLKLLQALNNKDNLNYITAGSSFYVPVQTVIQPANNNNNNTNNNNNNSNNNTNNNNNNNNTNPEVKKYDLTATSTTGGTAAFYVGGKAVTSAAAGDIVKVVATPDKSYALESIEVVYTDGSAAPKLDGDTFVMPTNAVTANVKFTKGYDVNIDCSYTNAVKVLVNGVVGSTAPQNSDVSIVSNNPSLSIDGNIDIYRADNGQHWKTIQPGRSFSMPSFAVTAKVKMKTVDTYGFYKSVVKSIESGEPAPETGSFVLQVNGSTVSRAAEGTTVKILASPSVGYTIEDVKVSVRLDDGSEGTSITVKGGESFSMPASDVIVKVSFAAESAKINIKPTSHGALVAKNEDGNTITLAATGDVVTLEATPDAGYEAATPIVTSTVDGTYVKVEGSNGTYTFTMPGGGADVVPQFVGAKRTFTWVNYLNGEANDDTAMALCRAIVNDAAPAEEYGEGQLLTIDAEPKEGFKFVKFEIWSNGSYNSEMTASVKNNGNFTVADGSIEVRAFFEAEMVAVKHITNNPNYKLFFVDANNFNKTVDKVAVGSQAVIILSDWTQGKADLDMPVVTEKGTGAPITVTEITFDKNSNVYENLYGTYSFTMPAAGVDITVPVTPKGFTLSFDTSFVTEANGLGDLESMANNVLWASTNDNSYGQALHTDFIRGVDAGLKVKITLTSEAADMGFKLTSIHYTVNGKDTKYLETSNGTCEFVMPAGNVVITQISCVRTAIKTSSIKTKLTNCSIEYVNANNPLQTVSSYKVGDTVCFRIKAKSGYGIEDGSVKLFDLSKGEYISALTGPNDGGYYTFVLEAGKTNLRIEAAASNTRTVYDVNVEIDPNFSGSVTVKNGTQGGKSWVIDGNTVKQGYGYEKDTITIAVSGKAKDEITTISKDGVLLKEIKGNGSVSFKMGAGGVNITVENKNTNAVALPPLTQANDAQAVSEPAASSEPTAASEPTQQPEQVQPSADVQVDPTPVDGPSAG